MHENIEQIKKYFLLLIGAYVAVRIMAFILIFMYPDILVRHLSDSSTMVYSPGDLILLIEYFSYLVIAIIMNRDMKEKGLFSIPILLLTFFSGVYGIVFYLIMVFAKTSFNTQVKYENN